MNDPSYMSRDALEREVIRLRGEVADLKEVIASTSSSKKSSQAPKRASPSFAVFYNEDGDDSNDEEVQLVDALVSVRCAKRSQEEGGRRARLALRAMKRFRAEESKGVVSDPLAVAPVD
jgi:hypothetical protein